MDTNVELMDGVKDEKVYNLIFDAVNRVEGAYNPHSARIRSVGNQYVVGLDIEVDGNITLHDAHKIAHKVEEEITSIVDIFDIIVHVEPMGKAHPEERFGINPGQE